MSALVGRRHAGAEVLMLLTFFYLARVLLLLGRLLLRGRCVGCRWQCSDLLIDVLHGRCISWGQQANNVGCLHHRLGGLATHNEDATAQRSASRASSHTRRLASETFSTTATDHFNRQRKCQGCGRGEVGYATRSSRHS